jgi:curved DNA-binding protein CbpA
VGVLELLRIAAGDEEAIGEATEVAGRSRDVVREAVAFFIEQILLSPDADSYRVLGANPEATSAELRRNMALLLRWLHPDLDPHAGRSVFATRVTLAWNDLKTSDRRAAYDRLRQISLTKIARKSRARGNRASNKRLSSATRDGRHHSKGRSLDAYWPFHGRLLRRTLLFLLCKTAP